MPIINTPRPVIGNAVNKEHISPSTEMHGVVMNWVEGTWRYMGWWLII